IARHQLDSVERRPIVRDADISAGAAIHVLEDKMGNMAARMLPHVGDGRKPPMQRRGVASDRDCSREAIRRHSGSVVHQTSPGIPVQKWLNEAFLNCSGLPPWSRKYAPGRSAPMTPISVSATPAARAAAIKASRACTGTVATTS